MERITVIVADLSLLQKLQR